MPLSIKKATLDDAAAIADLSCQPGYSTGEASIKKRLSALLNSTDEAVYVALMGGVVGWIQGSYQQRVEADPFVEITGLVVEEAQHGLGIGKKLIEEVSFWAYQRGCRQLRVRSNTMRKEAKGFYEQLGFRLKKEQNVYDKLL